MSYRSNKALSSNEPPFQPVWTALRSSTVNLQPQLDWRRQRIPQELQRVEDEADVPEKLKQILAWSLNLDAARPRTTASSSILQHGASARSCYPIQGDASAHPPGSVSEAPQQPSEKRRARSRNASNSIFASTVDLFASLRGKTIKDQPAAANSVKALNKKQPMVECTSCFEDTPKNDTSNLPCTHSYCKPCLTTLITTALENEASFPPKCCLTAIPLPTIMSTLDAKQRNTYKEKAAEFSIPHQQRWGEYESARDAGDAELARIIAQVEEMERRNPRERRRAEQRREAEQRRQEAELVRLEAERLREQEALRVEQARLEQHLQRVLRLSVEESCRRLEEAWNETRLSQMHSLDSRHVATERQYNQDRDEAIIQQIRKHERASQQTISNLEKRMSDIKERHTMEMTTFTVEQQTIEDDIFLEIQMHLCGKQDREARGHRLQGRFQEQRWERYQQLLAKHELETYALRANAQMEMQDLELVYSGNMAEIDLTFRTAMQQLSKDVAADRAWFHFLNQRGQNMVAEHARLMLYALEAGQEPVGLTGEVAMTIGPFIADVRPERGIAVSQYLEVLDSTRQGHAPGQPWREMLSPSPAGSASPTHSFVDLAETSRQLLKILEADPAPENLYGSPPLPVMSANELLLTNSAFVWMTDATPNDASQLTNVTPARASGLRRSQWVSRHRPHPRTPVSPSTTKPSSGCIYSSASRPCQFGSAPSSPDQPVMTVPPLVINRARNQTPRSPQDDSAPTQTVPAVTISTEPTAQARAPAHLAAPKPARNENQQQPRVLGGLVPVVPREEDRHVRLMNALIHVTHKRQSPSTGSASSADSLVMTPTTTTSTFSSIAPSSPPTSHRSSTTSRSSGDSLFLHSLISAATATVAPTAVTGPVISERAVGFGAPKEG
ncbi:hypothetical protein A1O7_04247 [Cladophialophora yegresii CBS 114405]|uniref:RING-type domain-containing protein n=1 Tax=Cladophialophora yegresii CBS 114405 TaxID=1182544 RepID=W9W6E5_9EURO|nr:uncharacterized protein A1O7_04247 [Cladophialophora yegresii CBS 114405]EXJ60096.1 hypothetical protein A1O7_04247 [Cladophialophora yegresii CBS 114405]